MWLEIYTPQLRPASAGNYSSAHTLFSVAFSFSQTHTISLKLPHIFYTLSLFVLSALT